MKRLILTSLISAVAVFAQSGSAPAPQTTPNTPAPKTQTAVKKHNKKSKKATKPATPAAAQKPAAPAK